VDGKDDEVDHVFSHVDSEGVEEGEFSEFELGEEEGEEG
jgi:hypothetical protein